MQHHPRRVLGIDPGTRFTGYAILELASKETLLLTCGVIAPAAKLPIEKRCLQIHRELSALIVEFSPTECAIEAQFVSHINPAAALKIGMAKSAAMLAAAAADLNIAFYLPASIKKALSGQGNATKEVMQRMVQVRFKLETAPAEDACDAIGAALCLAQKMEPVYV